MLRQAMLALSRNRTVRAGIVGFAPTRAVVRRFVAGETLEECLAVCRALTASRAASQIRREFSRTERPPSERAWPRALSFTDTSTWPASPSAARRSSSAT